MKTLFKSTEMKLVLSLIFLGSLTACGGGGSGGGGTTPAGTGTGGTGGTGGSGGSGGSVTYTVAGTISGLNSGERVTLLNNGANPTVVTSNAPFNFSTSVASAGSYAVTVGAQPLWENCQVVNGTGSGVVANVTNVSVTCSASPPVMTPLNVALDGGVTGASSPSALLLGSDGNFYGLQSNTSGGTPGGGANGNGAIFKITPAGVQSTIYSFNGSAKDGTEPRSLVLGADGNLYGTTYSGGAYGLGTVFKSTLAGVESVLYSFGAKPNDGANPNNPNSIGNFMLGADGNFYGTTFAGGVNGAGSIFKITPAGTETVLYSLNNATDGRGPGSLVLGTDGNYYVATLYGGANSQGDILQVTPTGVSKILYSFPASTLNTSNAGRSLIAGKNADIYGVTWYGGPNNAGTVFNITYAGVPTVVYSFTGGTDGGHPANLLLGSNGNLYGTSYAAAPITSSTIFEISSAGLFTTLYSFPSTFGNFNVVSQLVLNTDGHLYAVTSNGGTGTGAGNGTFFKF